MTQSQVVLHSPEAGRPASRPGREMTASSLRLHPAERIDCVELSQQASCQTHEYLLI